jgi:transcriptional regulator CBF1
MNSSALLSSLKSFIPSLQQTSLQEAAADSLAGMPDNKRKRGAVDHGAPRQNPSIRNAAAAAAAAVAAANHQQHQEDEDHQSIENLAQFISDATAAETANGSSAPSAAQTAQAALTHYQVPSGFDTGSGGGAADGSSSAGHFGIEGFPLGMKEGESAQQSQDITSGQSSAPKPPVGSEEWHVIRRNNHKEGS